MTQNGFRLSIPNPPVPPGYTLSWTNLSYSVNNVKILKNLNGILSPGSVTAVIGASGAGKSSFLDVLAGRVSPTLTSGQVTINGGTEIKMKQASRYCEQDDALLTSLTVYESLMYSAHFNLPSDTSRSKKVEIVDDLLQEFGLEGVKGTVIGGPIRKGCSGGQIRRVSVASQVIGLRNGILYLDEPTSGLDSVAADAMINCLVTLARKQNATVIVTIHQPSSETFDLFTHCLLLGNGSTVYLGPRDSAIAYFDRIGYPIPIRSNPCDFYLKLTSTDFDANKEEGRVRLESLIATFSQSPEYAAINDDIKNNPLMSSQKSASLQTNGFLQNTKYLVSRTFLNATKNPLAYWIRVAMYVALAVLMGTTWIDMGLNQSAAQDRMAGLFFAVAFLSFMSVAGIPAFLEERYVFFRENANNLYTVEEYLLSNFLVSIPFIFIITIAFSSISYFLMGLQPSGEKFCIFIAFLFFALMIAEAQTVMISVAVHIFVAALAITAFTNGLWMIVQGFFVQKKNIPAFWKNSFHQVDFQKYAYELLITNEMSGLTFNCESDGCACVIPSMAGNSNCSFTGEDVLHYFESGDVSYTNWLLVMAGIFIFFKAVTYILLKFQTRKHSY